MTTARNDNVVVRSLTQIGACGIFLLTILAAIPRSFRPTYGLCRCR